jgi:hypothetical protein
MSDAAFKTAAYPAYTSAELVGFIHDENTADDTRAKMEAELTRRERVAEGDVSVMTAGERLRFAAKSSR